MRVHTCKFRHAEISDFSPNPSNHQYVVTCQVSVGETIGVQVDQSLCYVMADVELSVVGQWPRGSLKEPAQSFITQFHQKNGQAGVGVVVGGKALNHIGVPC